LVGYPVYPTERGERWDGQVVVKVCRGDCSGYVVCHGVGGGGEALERIYYCPEVRAHVENYKVVGYVMPDSAERGCMKGSEVWFCGSKVSL